MASFDIGSVIDSAFGFTQRVATSNVNTTAIDTVGFESVAVLASVGAGNTNATINAVMAFWESDDNTIGNATAVSASRIISNPVLNAANTTFIASVVPVKRYLFVELDPSAAFTSNVSITGILGDAHATPTS